MSDVMGYVTYHLLNLTGQGFQPYLQVADYGMEFEGGYYGINHRYLGYLLGDKANVDAVVAALTAWRVQELTPNEALAWADEALPVNTQVEDMGKTKYVGPAGLDAEGRVQKPLSDTPWEV